MVTDTVKRSTEFASTGQRAIGRVVVTAPQIDFDVFSNLRRYVLSSKRSKVRRSVRRLSAHLCRFPSSAKVFVANLLVHLKRGSFENRFAQSELSRSRRSKFTRSARDCRAGELAENRFRVYVLQHRDVIVCRFAGIRADSNCSVSHYLEN